MKFKIMIIPAVILLIVLFSSAYTVDETEQVVITQFGEAIGAPKTEAGLYFKIPIIQQANYIPKNLLQWDGEPAQIPTLDKTFIYVDTFARWKIVDPLKFFETVNNLTEAQARLDDFIESSVRNLISAYPLIETVRWTNRKLAVTESRREEGAIIEKTAFPKVTVGRQKIVQMILKQANPKLNELGIELVDVQIKRLNYEETVRKSVYGRMIAERKQMAEQYLSEGTGEARKIEGEKEKELLRINSEAYEKAQKIKGKADAESTMIYARAYSKDPDFYSFLKTLDVYKKTMDKDNSLVLSTDADFFKYLKSYKPK
ncbi:MAG: protease modulator HflC [Deltaproteobacteria bacterium]|nr:protease modulator HflC [Deltaproteobacteria bacterium]